MSDYFDTKRISQIGQDLIKDYPPEVEKPAGVDVRRYESSIRNEPRPTKETHPYYSDKALSDRQIAWDYYTKVWARLDKITQINRSRREAEAAAEKAKQDAVKQERADAKRADLLATLERRFVAAGGTQAEFERDKDELLRQHLVAETLNQNSAEEQARRGQWQRMING